MVFNNTNVTQMSLDLGQGKDSAWVEWLAQDCGREKSRPPNHRWCRHVQFCWLNCLLCTLLALPFSHLLWWRDPQELQLWGEQAAVLVILSFCLDPFECQPKLGAREKRVSSKTNHSHALSYFFLGGGVGWVLFPLYSCDWIILTEPACVTLNPWASVKNRQESKATLYTQNCDSWHLDMSRMHPNWDLSSWGVNSIRTGGGIANAFWRLPLNLVDRYMRINTMCMQIKWDNVCGQTELFI